jgi:20S proteasome subunit beta 3
MSIFEYNGSAIVAMAGKECVAIGSDLRFGVQLQVRSALCLPLARVASLHHL